MARFQRLCLDRRSAGALCFPENMWVPFRLSVFVHLSAAVHLSLLVTPQRPCCTTTCTSGRRSTWATRGCTRTRCGCERPLPERGSEPRMMPKGHRSEVQTVVSVEGTESSLDGLERRLFFGLTFFVVAQNRSTLLRLSLQGNLALSAAFSQEEKFSSISWLDCAVENTWTVLHQVFSYI